MPFKSPNVSCCSRNPRRVCLATAPLKKTISGVVTRLTRASRQLIRHITATTPTTLKVLDMNWVTPWFNTLLTFSTSFDRRLINSP